MSESQEQLTTEGTIGHDDASPSTASASPFLSAEPVSPAYAITSVHQQKGSVRTVTAKVVNLELDVSPATPPTRLPNIEDLNISNKAEMEQDYSPASPASPFPPLQLPPVVPKPSIPCEISQEECLSDFIGKFVDQAMDAFSEASADSEPDYQWQSRTFARYALEQYNMDTNNKRKYELVEAKGSSHIIEGKGCSYVHVNFIAREATVGSADHLFFAEVLDKGQSKVLTCFRCLQAQEQIGGVHTSETPEMPTALEMGMQFCYACSEFLMHPKDGASYKAGHVALSRHYDAD